jgi:hypothetical protein
LNPSGYIIPIVASGVTMKQSLSGLSAFKTTEVYVTGGTYTWNSCV